MCLRVCVQVCVRILNAAPAALAYHWQVNLRSFVRSYLAPFNEESFTESEA